jgi:hypothetical protein
MNPIKQVKIFLILLLTVSPVFARPDREPVQAIVAGDLPDTALIQLSSWIAGSNRKTLFLMDSAMTAEVNRDLLQRV